MLRPLYVLLFKLMGWKIEGAFPAELKKYIVAVAPHTSNWDFVIGVMARSIVRMQRARFLGKSQLFKPPYGWFFKSLGGYPVDRSSHHDMVQQVAEIFNSHNEFVLAIAPEGTRKKVDRIKTGFYFIAKAAHVPIIPVGFDFQLKKIIIKEPFYPTDNTEADMKLLTDFYRSVKGQNPELGID
jgi:1-acyl-sn-glycerol-3-phosphate acyltransferase